MDIGSFLITDSQPAGLMEPTDCSLHHPAVFAKSAAVGRPAFGDDRFNSPHPKENAVHQRVIGPVRQQFLRFRKWPAGLAFDGWNRLHQSHHLGDIVPVGPRESNGKRNAARIRDDMVFGAFLAPVRGVGACFGPPKTARKEPLSTTALEKSILSAERRRSRSRLCTLLHTPASCQSRSLRQHVIPDPQPISWGRYSHGIPVLSTNKIPVKTSRFGTGGRPPLGLGGGFGSSGSINSHSSSLSSGLAISVLPDRVMGSFHLNASNTKKKRKPPRFKVVLEALTMPIPQHQVFIA